LHPFLLLVCRWAGIHVGCPSSAILFEEDGEVNDDELATSLLAAIRIESGKKSVLMENLFPLMAG